MATSVSWGTKFGSKVYIARDQFDTMISTVSKDKLLKENFPGIGRNVSGFDLPPRVTLMTVDLSCSESSSIT